MLIEYRKLIFPQEDLAEAISAHDKMSGARRLHGPIASLEVVGPSTVVVDIEGAAGNDGSPVTLDEEYLLAAMLRYCISKQVPIAQKAEKRTELEGGNLALSMSIDQQTSRSTGEEYYVLL